MATGVIKNPIGYLTPKTLSITVATTKPEAVTAMTVNVYRVGYFIYVTYSITVNDTFSGYSNLFTIPNARPYGGKEQIMITNRLASSDGFLKARVSASGLTAIVSCLARDVAGTFTGSFVYLTDVAPE